MYAPAVLTTSGLCTNATRFFLVVDADTIWLEDVSFVDAEGRALVSTYGADDVPAIRSSYDLHRYDQSLGMLLPGLKKRNPKSETAVVHHAVLDRVIVGDILARLAAEEQAEDDGGDRGDGGGGNGGVSDGDVPGALWRRFRDLATSSTTVSEYELYFAFAWKFHRSVVVRSATGQPNDY